MKIEIEKVRNGFVMTMTTYTSEGRVSSQACTVAIEGEEILEALKLWLKK